jgi:hypothetical protein
MAGGSPGADLTYLLAEAQSVVSFAFPKLKPYFIFFLIFSNSRVETNF